MRTAKIKNLPKKDYVSTEQINAICSNISFARKDLKKLLITSCVPSEGKSTMSSTIAMNMASRGKNVLLVECDLRRSSQWRLLDAWSTDHQRPTGLAYYLSGQCDLDEACFETDIPGFYVIPAGRNVVNPLQLIDSEMFVQMLDILEPEFDLIILDTPPIGAVVDAAQIAEHCDAAMLIIEAGVRRRHEAQEAVRQIKQTGCPILGCVLNKVKVNSIADKRYYRSGYYQYNYHNDSETQQAK